MISEPRALILEGPRLGIGGSFSGATINCGICRRINGGFKYLLFKNIGAIPS
jgi:hypothetical protein